MRLTIPLLVAGSLLALTGVFAQEKADEPSEPKLDAETQYLLALKAYRGELTTEQLEVLEATDPGPSIYFGSNRPSERALIRLFATLPDEAHARLRRDGVLKWKVAALPETQRGWIGELATYLEGLGEGPYPVAGRKADKRPNKPPLELTEKADPNATETGFVRVDVPGQELPCYSWWISAPGAKRAAWLTVVNAVNLATREWQVAHRERLAEIERSPDSPPIAPNEWPKYREPKRSSKRGDRAPAANAPRFFSDTVYEAAQKVYRGRRGAAELAALKAMDPDLDTRLKSKDALANAARTLFARLSDKEHQTLRADGLLRWYSQDLSKDQLRILEPVIEELNRRAAESGEGDLVYSLLKYSGTCTGFSILEIPGVEGPVLSWWVRSNRALNPTWVTLINTAAAKEPAYYRAHLLAISTVQ